MWECKSKGWKQDIPLYSLNWRPFALVCSTNFVPCSSKCHWPVVYSAQSAICKHFAFTHSVNICLFNEICFSDAEKGVYRLRKFLQTCSSSSSFDVSLSSRRRWSRRRDDLNSLRLDLSKIIAYTMNMHYVIYWCVTTNCSFRAMMLVPNFHNSSEKRNMALIKTGL